MGREATCTARMAGKTSAGKALLETTELIFRGDFRIAVPFKEMTEVAADSSNLTLRWSAGTLVLALGAEAHKWAERIRNPPSRLDKLGVKPTSVVALVQGARPKKHQKEHPKTHPDLDEFVAEVEERGAQIAAGKPGARVDLIFLAVEQRADLRALAGLKRSMRADAAVWVLRPKGSAAVTEGDVRATAKAAGLVDVKVAAFSPSRTAEKLVIPVAARGAKRPAKS